MAKLKLPGWLKQTSGPPKANLDGVTFTFRVRRWHPGFWWVVAKALVGRLRRKR